MHEQRFKVRAGEHEIVCERPDGVTERVAWRDLVKVTLVTNDMGPWGTDFYWVLEGKNKASGCAIPGGATGEDHLIKALDKLSGFDHQAVIDAMSCTENKKFICWEKENEGDEV